jgi:hypothetical protein
MLALMAAIGATGVQLYRHCIDALRREVGL